MQVFESPNNDITTCNKMFLMSALQILHKQWFRQTLAKR